MTSPTVSTDLQLFTSASNFPSSEESNTEDGTSGKLTGQGILSPQNVSILLIPVNNISVEESYQRFCGAMQKAARHSIPRGFRPTYTSCLDEDCQYLLKQYEESGDPDIADHLVESLDAARRHHWEELTSKMNFMQTSRKSWALIRRLGAAQQPPKSTHPSVSANAHLIQLLKHCTTSIPIYSLKRRFQLLCRRRNQREPQVMTTSTWNS